MTYASDDYLMRPLYDDIEEEARRDRHRFAAEVLPLERPAICDRCREELPACECWGRR